MEKEKEKQKGGDITPRTGTTGMQANKSDQKTEATTTNQFKMFEDGKEVTMWMLLTKFANLAFANVYSMLMNSCSMRISTVISGHLGDERMQAGLGISNSITFIFLLTVSMGLNRALDTLHTTAYG